MDVCFVSADLLGTMPSCGMFLLCKTKQAFVFCMRNMMCIRGAIEAAEQ